MRITSISSPAFGSIQIQKSKMDWMQRGASERLSNSIKFCDKYEQLTSDGDDLDIYILPKNNDLEVRLMDPYSGNFIKHKNGEVIKTPMKVWPNNQYEKVADKVLDYYEKVSEGKIKRPEENLSNYLDKDSDLARVNPRKCAKIKKEVKEYMEDLGLSRKKAEKEVFESYAAFNSDGVF